MRALLLLIGVACIGIAFWFLRTKGGPASVPVTLSPASITGTPAVSVSALAESSATFPPPAANSATPPVAMQPPDEAALREADQVGLMIRDYRTLAGENPVGTNAEIMAAIMGGNPKHATLGPPEGMSLNKDGELIDRWGTPYFFHQLSRDHMEIRSAGPDQVMWTADDPVVK